MPQANPRCCTLAMAAFACRSAGLGSSLALLLGGWPAQSASRDSSQPNTESFVFRIEEDAFSKVLRHTDRNYTGGGSITLIGGWVETSGLTRPSKLLDRLLHIDPDQLRVSVGPSDQHASGTIGVTVFTPKDLGSRDVIRGDRPYASLIYASIGRLAAYPERRFALTSDLRIGMLGLDTARQLQSHIHFVGRGTDCDPVSPDNPQCGAVEPRGWAHQISAGGEPTIGYGLQWDWELLRFPGKGQGLLRPEAAVLDAKLTARGDLGYLTSAYAGLTIRLGRITTEVWGFEPNQMGTVRLNSLARVEPKETGDLVVLQSGGPSGATDQPQPTEGHGDEGPSLTTHQPATPSAVPLQGQGSGADGRSSRQATPSVSTPSRDGPRVEVYAFASAGARAVLWNSLLQGQFRHSDYRVSFSDVRHLVGEYSMGIVLGTRWATMTWVALAGRTPEADFLEVRSHNWASFFVTVNWANQ